MIYERYQIFQFFNNHWWNFQNSLNRTNLRWEEEAIWISREKGVKLSISQTKLNRFSLICGRKFTNGIFCFSQKIYIFFVLVCGKWKKFFLDFHDHFPHKSAVFISKSLASVLVRWLDVSSVSEMTKIFHVKISVNFPYFFQLFHGNFSSQKITESHD